jgi:hypothetical protein
MFGPKDIADVLTLIRGLLGIFLAWLGFMHGADSLPQAVLVMLLCWTGDLLDGGIARLSRPPRHSWLGDHDLQVDVLVSLGLGAYLVGAGFVEWYIAVIYLVVWGLLIWRFGPDENLLMLVQAFIYFCFIWVALRDNPQVGRWLIAWILAVTLLNWRRFLTRVVPGFINGMRAIWRNNSTPDGR